MRRQTKVGVGPRRTYAIHSNLLESDSVNKLICFDITSLQQVEIFADLIVNSTDNKNLFLKYQNNDPLSDVSFPTKDFVKTGTELQRMDELWKSTCFELFLNVIGQNQYYEFNFSLDGFWNCYHFQGYRFPQPATASTDFEIESMKWSNNLLEISLRNFSNYMQFNVGLTAVINDKKNQINYYALKHESGKPDFHVKTSFILQRG